MRRTIVGKVIEYVITGVFMVPMRRTLLLMTYNCIFLVGAKIDLLEILRSVIWRETVASNRLVITLSHRLITLSPLVILSYLITPCNPIALRIPFIHNPTLLCIPIIPRNLIIPRIRLIHNPILPCIPIIPRIPVILRNSIVLSPLVILNHTQTYPIPIPQSIIRSNFVVVLRRFRPSYRIVNAVCFS